MLYHFKNLNMVKQQELFEVTPDFDSKEELLFHYYLQELKSIGLIKRATYQPPLFQLFDGLHRDVILKKKKGLETCQVEVMKSKHYTADWEIEWHENADKKLIWTLLDELNAKPTINKKDHPENYIPFYHDKFITVVDVKGGAGSMFGRSNTSAVTFSTNQKWVYDKYGVYIQKVVITLDSKGLFARTFTPRQVIIDEVYKKDMRDKKGGYKWRAGDSKLKYEPIILEEYLRLKQISL